MRLSLALSGLAASTFIALLGWGTALFSINPEHATAFEWILFLSPLFLSLLGAFSLLFLILRKFVLGDERAAHRIGASFREGFLTACFLFALLFLRKNEWLVWWDALLLLVPFLLVELFFLFRRMETSGRNEKIK